MRPDELRAARRNRGLTIKRAAELMGVPPWVLKTTERGHVPRPESAKKIAEFYGLRVTDIWPDADQVEAA